MGIFLSREYLKFDRVIDGENQIIIGIISKKEPNPFSSQAIQIGRNGNLKRLENFIQIQNCLIFEFESNTELTLSKRENDIIIYYKDPNTQIIITKPMDIPIRKFFKPIQFGDLSYEFDKIYNFINDDNV